MPTLQKKASKGWLAAHATRLPVILNVVKDLNDVNIAGRFFAALRMTMANPHSSDHVDVIILTS